MSSAGNEGSAPWLVEWVENEKAIAEELHGLVRVQADEPFGLSPKDLLRISYGDKFHFGKQTAFSSGEIPLKLLLPFYEQVIIPILPCRTRSKFVRLYGLTPEDFAYLYRNGRVLPIFSLDKSAPIRDYLGPLVKEQPPLINRSWSVFDALWSQQPHRIHEQHKMIFARLERIGYSAVNGSLYGPARTKSKDFFIWYLPFCCRILDCLGLSQLVDEILMKYELYDAAEYLFVYYDWLGTPYSTGLGAAPQRHPDLVLTKCLPPTRFESLGDAGRFSLFPLEIGELLTDYYEIVFPVDPTMEAVDEVYRDKALVKARRVLTEFDQFVQQNNKHEAVKKAKDIKEIFYESLVAIESYDRRMTRAKWALYSVAAGAVGALGMVQPAIGLLASLGYKVAEDRSEDITSAKLAGLRFNPLSAAIWRFQKDFKSVDGLRNARRKLKKKVWKPSPSKVEKKRVIFLDPSGPWYQSAKI